MKTFSFSGFIAALLATPALATVNIQFEFGSLRDSGGTPLASTTLVLLVADTSGDGFFPSALDLNGATLSNGQTIGGDKVLYSGTTVNTPANGTISGTVFKIDYAALGINQGDLWAIYWFPGVSAEGAVASPGDPYGFYRTSVLDQATVDAVGATDAMVFPADTGATVRTAYYDSQVLGTFGIASTANSPDPSDYTASLTVVPEPSTIILGALGGLALLRRRRS